MKLLSTFFIVGLLLSCKEKESEAKPIPIEDGLNQVKTEIDAEPDTPSLEKTPPISLEDLPDTTFVRLADYSDGFAYDLRYATTNNFLKSKVYDCAECYTRVITAKALLKANQDLNKLSYRIKFFDCYRPNSVQHKMWKIMPNPQYVANPVKGSVHNKGGAVDITLVTFGGEELNMGTDFDFFGKEAHYDNMDLPELVLNNRKLLRETMEKHGFLGIRTEWWHYGLKDAYTYEIADFKWDCE